MTKKFQARSVDQVHINANRPRHRRKFGDCTTSFVTILLSKVGSGVGYHIENLFIMNNDSAIRTISWKINDAPGGGLSHLLYRYVLLTGLSSSYPETAIGVNAHLQDRRHRFLQPGDELLVKCDAITTAAPRWMVIYQEIRGIPG